MATRSLNVQITGDARNLNRVLKDTESRTKRSLGAIGKGFAVAGAAAAGGLAVGLKKSADAAIEAEKSQAKMVTQLKAAGVSYKAHAKQIDEVIQKTSRLSGLDDEDLQDSFTNIVRVTGDVNKSLKLTGLAADFARAKHMDVAKAGELVGKVAGGNVGILSRYGITIDKGASSTEALALLQKKFAGQAEAYGKTTAGAMDRASVASENLGEIVGAKITPLLAKGATALVDLVDKAGKLGGPIREVSGTVGNFAKRVQAAFSGGNKDATGFANNVQRLVGMVIGFLKDLGSSIRRIFRGSGEDFRQIGQAFLKVERIASAVVIAIAKRTIPVLKVAIESIAGIVRGVVRIVAGILSGDFSKAWDGAKIVVRSALRGIVGIIKGLGGIILEAMGALAKAMIRGLVNGLKALPGAIKNAVINGVKAGVDAASGAVGDVIAKINPLGDGIGRAAKSIAGDGLGFLGGSAGASGAGLMGADLDLGPFARVGAGMGLHVSSGLRPGAITSSGNPSYHGSGDAIDMAGPPGSMMRFFRTMRGMFGSKLRELIYTPGGVGIKDGRPYRYTGQVAADHYDHVHVAYTGPFGDGPGRAFRGKVSTFGPPLEGAGTTASGVSSAAPGIALYNRSTLGKLFRVRIGGHSAVLRQTDIGPAPWTGRVIDVTGAGARKLGFSPASFPTDSTGSAVLLGASSGGHSASGGTHLTPAQAFAKSQFQNSRAAARGVEGAAVTDAGLIGPGQGRYGQKVADAGLAEAGARADDNLPGLIKALQAELRLKRRRLKKIRKALRRRLRPATRKRLTDEATTLVGEIADLRDSLKEYRADAAGGAKTVSAAEELDAGVAPEGQALNAAGTAVVDVPAAPDTGGGTTTTSDPATEQLAAVMAEVAANQKQLLALAGQGDQIVAAVVAAVNGAIGGKVGLGYMTPGAAGQVARY